MKIETYRRLIELREQFGPRKFGRICQKLLALALRMNSYDHVVEREIQGVDIDASKSGGTQYAIEVKTTTGAYVQLVAKDFEALESRGVDGYIPVIAVLRFSALGDWVAVDAKKLVPGRHFVDLLTPHRIKSLEDDVNESFESMVNLHVPQILRDGPKFLDVMIREQLPPAKAKKVS
jgi:predicted RecB family endonuclease